MEENERIIVQTEEEEEEEEEEGLLVQQQQEAWSWGAGTEGQLGTGKLQDEHNPIFLTSLSSFGPISFLSCGGAHVIALTPGGRVLTWGRGTSGQLGHGEMVNCLQPKAVDSLEGFVISHASAGWNHSGFVSDKGCLFTCGDGSFGQLGHGDYMPCCSAEKVSYFESRHVEQIACGMRHSVVLLVKDHLGCQVYGFGSGKRGQLGISNERVRSVSLAQAALGLDDVKIISVYANGDHSAALCAEGKLYAWGRGFAGASDVHIPQCVTSYLSFSHAAVGWNHALLLRGDGELFMLGSYGHGILSDSRMTRNTKDESDKDVVWRIAGLDGIKVLQIAAGAEHSALVTDDESVMTWGWGEHGQLGLGNTGDQAGPHVVNFGHAFAQKHLVSRVYCGSGFTYAIRTPAADSI